MEPNDNARSCAQIANHQRVGRGIKRAFSGGNGGINKAVRRDEGKVNDIREKTWFL